MADLKISQLPVATTPLAGTELVPIVQGGVTEQTTVQAILTGTVPSGTANGVLYLNGSKVVTSGSGLTFDGTNLGVGTSSPKNNTGYSTLTLNNATNGGVLQFCQADTTVGQLFFDGSNAVLRSVTNIPLVFGVNNVEQMRLTSTGLFIGGTAGAEKINIIANTATSGLEKGFAVTNDVDSNCFISITGTAATDKRAVIGPTSPTALVFQTSGSQRVRIPAAGGMVIGTAAIATSATDGFLYVPGCAGNPTGTPTAYTGRVPIVVDTTNNKLYFYSGGAWRDAGP